MEIILLTIPAGLSSAKVTARYIGFKQASVTVTASGTQDFSLSGRCFENGRSYGNRSGRCAYKNQDAVCY